MPKEKKLVGCKGLQIVQHALGSSEAGQSAVNFFEIGSVAVDPQVNVFGITRTRVVTYCVATDDEIVNLLGGELR